MNSVELLIWHKDQNNQRERENCAKRQTDYFLGIHIITYFINCCSCLCLDLVLSLMENEETAPGFTLWNNFFKKL